MCKIKKLLSKLAGPCVAMFSAVLSLLLIQILVLWFTSLKLPQISQSSAKFNNAVLIKTIIKMAPQVRGHF